MGFEPTTIGLRGKLIEQVNYLSNKRTYRIDLWRTSWVTKELKDKIAHIKTAFIDLFFLAEIGDFEDQLGGNYLNGLKLLPRQVWNCFVLFHFHFDYLLLIIFVEDCEVLGFKEFHIFLSLVWLYNWRIGMSWPW